MQRSSKNREKLIALFNKEHLLSAHDCYKKLKNMDLATTYRNIKQLLEMNVIKEVNINTPEHYYELNDSNHQHLICNKCGKIFEVEISNEELIDLLNTKIQTRSISNIQITITGICVNCENEK